MMTNEPETMELTEIAATGAQPSMERWDTQMRSFRVRLMRFDRPQSKTITIRANNEAGARAQAQGRSGRDWRIAGITAI